ncbi:hypothetical protein ACYKS1_02520 [Klebsiella pneumoniae]
MGHKFSGYCSAFFCACCLYLFCFKKPQSEGYQLKKQVIDLIEEKGSLTPVDARSLEMISNPDSRRIESQPDFPVEEKVIDKGSV